MLNMFGRGYEEIGSSDKGLILKNSGKVKIQWGKKFIDLLDSNGNLNAKVQNLIKKVSSKDDIKQDGFYYYNNILLAKIGEDIIELVHEEDNGVYVSFLEEQKTDSDQKYTALKNIGFVYPNQSKQNIYPKNGIVYIEDSQSLFIVNNGNLIEYKVKFPNPITEQFVISRISTDEDPEGALLIEGEGLNNSLKFNTLKVYSKKTDAVLEATREFQFKVGNKNILLINIDGLESSTIKSFGADDNHGYRIWEKDGKYLLDIDKIHVRDGIDIIPDDYYDTEVYSKRYFIDYFDVIVSDTKTILYGIFDTDCNSRSIPNESLVEIPMRVIKCNTSTKNGIEYFVPIQTSSYIKLNKNNQEKTAIDPLEEMYVFRFKHQNNKLYFLNNKNELVNYQFEMHPFLDYDGEKHECIVIDGIYYVFKELTINRAFAQRSLYVISEPNEDPRLKYDFVDPGICLQQNDRRSTRLTEYDQIIHTKVGNIDKYKNYKDDQNKQGLFSDLSVFVGGEYRQPLPTYKRVGNTIEEVPSDIEYKHFPRYSQKLNRGMTIPIFNHDEIILPKKWVPQAANYIEDLTAFSGTLETRDDNLYEGKLFLYKISGTSSNQIQIRFKLSPQYNKFDERINDEYTEYFKFYDGSREVKENDYKQNTILLAQYKNGSINVLRNPGLITIQEDDSDISTEPNFDTLNFKDTDNIKFDLSKNNKTIVIKSDINTKLENRIKTLENKVEQLRTDLDNLSDTVSNLSSSLSSLWSTVNNLNIPPDYGSDISDLKSRVTTLEGNNNNNAS